MTDRPTALYRLYDADETLLYVGIAVDPETRWRVHAGEKTWWPQVAVRKVEWLPSRPAAEASEIAAIIAELPRHNVTHSTTRKRGDAKQEFRSKATAIRQIRVATQMWRDFGKAAKAMGTNRATVLRQLLRWYLRVPGAKLPERPEREAWANAPTPE